MATIRKRKKADGTPVFHVQVRMTGFPARTASFRTMAAAKKWKTMIEAEMIDGRHFRSVEARRRSLADTIDRYVKEELPKKRGARTREPHLTWWKAELGHLKLADISAALIVECRNKLKTETYRRATPGSKDSTLKPGEPARQFQRRPATVNRYLATLSHVFTVARREWHWMTHKPMDGVSKLPEGPGRDRTLSDQERRDLFEQTAKDPTLHTFVTIALSTACRAGELKKLTWADVDLKEGKLLFQATNTKNGKPRTVWLHGTALQLLKDHAKVRRITGGHVFENSKGKGLYDYSGAFRAAVKAAGITGLRFHDLRHTAASILAGEGASEQQLRAIGGWRSNVVSRYVHLAAKDSKAALERLSEKIDGNSDRGE